MSLQWPNKLLDSTSYSSWIACSSICSVHTLSLFLQRDFPAQAFPDSLISLLLLIQRDQDDFFPLAKMAPFLALRLSPFFPSFAHVLSLERHKKEWARFLKKYMTLEKNVTSLCISQLKPSNHAWRDLLSSVVWLLKILIKTAILSVSVGE